MDSKETSLLGRSKLAAYRWFTHAKGSTFPNEKQRFPVANEFAFRRAKRKAESYGEFGGWAVSLLAMRAIASLVSESRVLSVVEFGPGVSTVFLDDYLSAKSKIVCYEHQSAFADRVSKATSDRVCVNRVPLVQYNNDFAASCNGEKIAASPSRVPESEFTNTRLSNAFYDVDAITDPIDLLVVDGPNGNGRSLAFAKARPGLCDGALILIDDCNHYPFVQDCLRLIDCEIVASTIDQRESWILLRVKSSASGSANK